jgi:hypothetical protein
MAMNKDTLGLAIADAIIDSDCPTDYRTKIETQWKDIADIIIKHIQTNGQVTVAAGIGVSTAGSATAQTGVTTTTGTGTIS